jgi:probable F420-dependent oxidoreductase
MKFGICIPSHRDIMSVDAVKAVAQRAETLGYDSVWVNDHIIIPFEYLDRFTARYYDPYMVLADAAARTQRIKLGTSVIVLPYRHAIIQAKMLTTLDAFSGGRVILGVGSGGVEPEFQALGVDFAQRGALTDEALKVILELWTQENPNFQGDHYTFSDIKFAPKPTQKPRIPIWVGGTSRASLRRTAQFGDAWHPIANDPDLIEHGMKTLQEDWHRFQRNGEPSVNLRMGCRIYSQAQPKSRQIGWGSAEQVTQDIQQFQKFKFEHMVLDFAVGVTEDEWNFSFESFARDIMHQLST